MIFNIDNILLNIYIHLNIEDWNNVIILSHKIFESTNRIMNLLSIIRKQRIKVIVDKYNYLQNKYSWYCCQEDYKTFPTYKALLRRKYKDQSAMYIDKTVLTINTNHQFSLFIT